MQSSSREYWEARWNEDPAAPSWRDAGARALEEGFLKRSLSETHGPYLELGCGNGDLLRMPVVGPELLAWRYRGIEGSSAAASEAVQYLLDKARSHRAEIIEADLTHPNSEWFKGIETVISKRTLQNLAPEARAPLLKMMAWAPHGILIEDFLPARSNLDRVRHSMGLPDLPIPAFNWPLYESEIRLLAAKCHAFLGRYYSITRTIPLCPMGIQAAAYDIAKFEQERGLTPPPYGPVVGLVW